MFECSEKISEHNLQLFIWLIIIIFRYCGGAYLISTLSTFRLWIYQYAKKRINIAAQKISKLRFEGFMQKLQHEVSFLIFFWL